MATGQAGTVLRYLRQFLGGNAAEAALDRQLLERFVAVRDEAAFEAIVRRHGPMVWGVCRRILANAADAEDAFQATFLVLVRKARSIRRPERLANWLYGVAIRTARTARAAASRRCSREKDLVEMPADLVLEEKTRQELRWTLDEELVRLPDKYRLPIVLCYLEGRTKEEAAQALGWPHGTVSIRLARARDLLRGRLARRGLALPVAFLAAFVMEETTAAALPPALASATVKSGLLYASTQALTASGIPASVIGLTQGVLKAMFMTKVKIAAAVLLGVGLLGAGVATFEAVAGDQPAGTRAESGTAVAGPMSTKAPAPSSSVTQKPADSGAAGEPDKAKPPAIRTARDLRRALNQPVEIAEIPPGTPLRDVLDLMSDKFGLSVRIDYAEFVRENTTDDLGQALDMKMLDQQPVGLRPVKGTSLAVVLNDLLSQVHPGRLTYVVKGTQVVIVPTSRLTTAEQGGTALREPVHVEVEERSLAEALRELAETTGANIILDVRLKEKAKAPVTASLQHVPLETAVRLLADMADLKAVALENVIYVTTSENAQKWLREQRAREFGVDPSELANPLGVGGLGGPGGPGGFAVPPPSSGAAGGPPANTDAPPAKKP